MNEYTFAVLVPPQQGEIVIVANNLVEATDAAVINLAGSIRVAVKFVEEKPH